MTPNGSHAGMDMRNKNKLIPLSFFLLTLIFFNPPTSQTQEIRYTPFLSLSGEFNDNVLFERTGSVDDWVGSVIPAIGIDYKTERFTLNSLAMLNFKEYLSETFLDREDQYYNVSSKFRITERLNFKGRLYYLDDVTLESRVLDIEEVGSDTNQEIEPGIEQFLSGRKRYYALGSFDFELTELSDIEAGYRFLETDYDFEGNSDYQNNEIGVSFFRKMEGQRDRIGFDISFDQNSSEISKANSYLSSLIWYHEFSDIMRLYTKVGLRYTEREDKNTGDTDENFNTIANVNLRRIGEKDRILVGFKQNLRTASSGRTVNVSRLYFESNFKLSQRLDFDLEGDFYITEEEGDQVSNEDIVFFDVIPSMKFWLSENQSVTLAYNFTVEYNRSIDENKDIIRNRFWVLYEIGFPREW